MKMNLKIALILSAAVLAACGGDEQQPEQPATSNSAVESAPRTAPRSTADQRGDAAAVNQADQEELIAAPRLTGESPVAGDGLNLLVFASDRAEYQESLRLIAEQT